MAETSSMSKRVLEYWKTRRYCACGCHRHVVSVDSRGRSRTRILGHTRRGPRRFRRPLSQMAVRCLAEAAERGSLRLYRRGWMRAGGTLAFRQSIIDRLVREGRLRFVSRSRVVTP